MNDLEKYRAMILAKTVRNSNGCWIWQGTKSKLGYGRIRINGKTTGVHRISYEAFNGTLNGMYALHKCDVPSCVNPDHIFAGTLSDNQKDCFAKKRSRGGILKVGVHHRLNKFTPEQVIEIRLTQPSGLYSNCELGRMYGVNESAIRSIMIKRTWRHL